jgi:hypothetical protein
VPEVRVPDGISPIVAYRLWQVDPGWRLRSMSAPSAWSVGEWVHASCMMPRRGWHAAPSAGCTCGLYAVKTRRQAADLLARTSAARPSAVHRGLILCGVVELAGTIIEHDGGYRAERARLVELLPIRGAKRHTVIAAARLGVRSGEPIGPPRDPLSLIRRAWWRYVHWCAFRSRAGAGSYGRRPSKRGVTALPTWMVAWLILVLVEFASRYLFTGGR